MPPADCVYIKNRERLLNENVMVDYSNHVGIAAIAINDLLLRRTLWKAENHPDRDLSQTHAEPSSQKQCLSLGYP